MKQFIVLIAIQLCLCVCTVTADADFCPAGFEKVEGIKDKCFYYYVNSTGNMNTKVNFADAMEICRGKNSTVCEPKSREDGDTIFNFVIEKWNGTETGSNGVWINYRDIQDQVSPVGAKGLVLLTSSYMGSLSTFMPMPIEWWNDRTNKGGKRNTGMHCAVWGWNGKKPMDGPDGVYDSYCTHANYSVVCETDDSHNLKQFLKVNNENVAV